MSKKHSSQDWANFIKSLPLSLGQTLELIDMMHWVYEDGWIQRNKKFHTDTNDHEMRDNWNKSASNLIVENLLK